jgi:hypothetical protein
MKFVTERPFADPDLAARCTKTFQVGKESSVGLAGHIA